MSAATSEAPDCLDEERLAAFFERRLSLEDRARLELHCDGCERCRAWLADAAKSWFPASSDPGAASPPSEGLKPLDLRRGALFGRYMLLEALGQGGMGVVLLAYDPELDRKVALKVLRVDGGTSASQEERLRKEGQALARLAHPNVLAVHDVGTIEGRVFVTLEYVEGQTLAQWLATPKPWRDVVATFRQAGEGLAAAHAAGLVHRDFKPANVLLGADGRVRVADFGLADAEDALAGTPAYLAPEQLRGQVPDARADQFSFCLALAEALLGSRPSSGASADTLAALAKSRARQAPLWLWQALARGLAVEPSERAASLAELLHALEGPERRRVPVWAVVTAATAALALAAAAPSLLAHRRTAACIASGAEPRWSPQVAERLRVAFEGTRLPFASDSWRRVVQALEAHVSALGLEQRRVCEGAHLHHVLPEPVLLARLACLERSRHELDVVVGLFETADAPLVTKAVEVVNGLGPPAACAEKLAPKPVPAKLAAQVDAVRLRLTEAATLEAAGRYEHARTAAQEALESQRGLEQRGLEAEAELMLALVEDRLAHFPEAEAGYRRALWAAEASGDDARGGHAATQLVRLLGVKLNRRDEAHEVAHRAQAWVERSGGEPVLAARLLSAEGALERIEGHYPQAEAKARQALALREALLPPRPLAVAESLIALTSDLRLQGKYEAALAEARRALALHEQTLGAMHPELAQSVANVGILSSILGRTAEALAAHRRVLALRRIAYADGHPEVARARLNLGTALSLADQPLEGLEHLEAAAEGFGAAGLEVDAATAWVNSADAARIANRPERAEAFGRKAVALREKALPADSPEQGYAWMVLGDALVMQRRAREGLPLIERTIALWESKLGKDYQDLAAPLVGLGRARLQLGTPLEAIPPLERAVALMQGWPNPADVAEAKLLLAQAWWAAGRERDKALVTGLEAYRVLAEAGALRAERRAEAESWLRAHGVQVDPAR